MLCGSLHCDISGVSVTNPQPITFRTPSTKYKNFTHPGGIVCQIAELLTFYSGPDRSLPGLVPNGASCGYRKVCLFDTWKFFRCPSDFLLSYCHVFCTTRTILLSFLVFFCYKVPSSGQPSRHVSVSTFFSLTAIQWSVTVNCPSLVQISQFAQRAFSHSPPVIWSVIPLSVRNAPTTSTFNFQAPPKMIWVPERGCEGKER